jgi:hypothetical protein
MKELFHGLTWRPVGRMMHSLSVSNDIRVRVGVRVRVIRESTILGNHNPNLNPNIITNRG